MRLLLPLAAAFAAAALPAQSCLNTTLAGGGAQNGCMFDLQAICPLQVTGFEVHLSTGTWNLEVYRLTAPDTSYFAFRNIPSAWTLVQTINGVTSLGVGTGTPISLSPGNEISISQGEVQGIYVTVTNGPALRWTTGTSQGALYASDSALEFFQGSAMGYPFGTAFSPRVFNGAICYTPDPNCATKQNYGAGCYDGPRMVSELFPANTSPIDLVNTEWTFTFQNTPDGGFYEVTPGGLVYDTNITTGAIDLLTLAPDTSSSNGTWDDASSLQVLPFSIQHPNANGAAGWTASIMINSNGRIYIGDATGDNTFASNGANSGTTPGSFAGSAGAGLPVVAGFMNDLDPTVQGNLWYEVGPGGGVRVTWSDILNWQDTGGPTAVANDIQMTILPNIIFLSFGPSLGNGGSAGNVAITGYSAGGGEPDVRIDWDTDIPPIYFTGTARTAPSIDSSARPIIGTTVDIQVTDLGTSALGGFVAGNPIPTGVPLPPLSLPSNCLLFASPGAISVGPAIAGSYTVSFAINNDPTLIGTVLGIQAFGLDLSLAGTGPGNPLGAILGNALEWYVGAL